MKGYIVLHIIHDYLIGHIQGNPSVQKHRWQMSSATLLKIDRRKNGDSLATMDAKLSPFFLGSPFFLVHRNLKRAIPFRSSVIATAIPPSANNTNNNLQCITESPNHSVSPNLFYSVSLLTEKIMFFRTILPLITVLSTKFTGSHRKI